MTDVHHIYDVVGHTEQISHFLKVRDSGRLHHAWLLEGVRGIGKTQTAMNLAAAVLGAPHRLEGNAFGVEYGKVRDHICAGSHPDFRIVQTPVDSNGKPKSAIPVEDVRKLTQFFSLKPALGGYRVAILDAMDDLNASGANAILKTLEEPPAKCLLFLIYHRQSGLLPTIRSRCQRLKFDPLQPADLDSVLKTHAGDLDVPDDILALSGGSPGEALRFVQADVFGLHDMLRQTFERDWPEIRASSVNLLLQRAAASEIHFDFFLKYLDDRLFKLAEDLSGLKSAALAKAWTQIRSDAGEASLLKLDLTERTAKCLSALQDVSRKLGSTNAV